MPISLIPRVSPNREPAEIMDPEKLFKIRYALAASHPDAMVRFAYKVIPYSLLKSFALTFDPTTKFRIGLKRISPVTRSRTRQSHSITSARTYGTEQRGTTRSRSVNSSSCIVVSDVSTPFGGSTTTAGVSHGKRPVTIKDTTRSTRPIGSDHGEFELFNFNMFSPDRSVRRNVYSRSEGSATSCQLLSFSEGRSQCRGWTQGGAATFSDAKVAEVRAATMSDLSTVMQQNVARLLVGAIPSTRRYSLFRNIVELRDLPRSISSLRGTLIDLGRLFASLPTGVPDKIFRASLAKHVPEEYVSFWFGWRQTYQDIIELMEKPKQISKEINALIDRSGNPTTYRARRTFPGTLLTTPGFSYDPLSFSSNSVNESFISQTHRHERHHEMRLVINASFDFPKVGVPRLREDLFYRKLGLVPTPTDLYNLIPWTWLIDWFTGLGNYVQLVDEINTDKNLYNWGFLTGITRGSISTQLTTSLTHSSVVTLSNGQIVSSPQTQRFVHTSAFHYKAQIRKDIVSAYGVKSTLEPNTLSSYQQSIISAILLNRRY